MAQPRLVLGSASPRRLELLAQIGIIPDQVLAADIDETPFRQENPKDYVRRMALEKAAALSHVTDDLVLCADTIVSAGRKILGKPEDADEAARFLQLLSGRRHLVMTAICLRLGDRIQQRLVSTQIRFRNLSPAEIGDYIRSGEWQGKAGGYAIQGRAGAFPIWMQGSFSAVVGLPLAETASLLAAHGIKGQVS